jgi:hypothetical protein
VPRDVEAGHVGLARVLQQAAHHLPPATLEAAAGEHCRAIDGDTLRCGRERVRLLGVYAPELNEPGGPEAHQRLQQRHRRRGAAHPPAGARPLRPHARGRVRERPARPAIGHQREVRTRIATSALALGAQEWHCESG